MVCELQQKLALIFYSYLFQIDLTVIIQKYHFCSLVCVNHQINNVKTKGYTFCSAIKLYSGLCNKIKNVNTIEAVTKLYNLIQKRRNNKKITLGVQLKSPQIIIGELFQS